MMIEAATCDICHEPDVVVSRQYYYYNIACTCCNGPNDPHFEIVKYCSKCTPRPPRKIVLSGIQPVHAENSSAVPEAITVTDE